MATCSDCAYWQQMADGSDIGRCRRYPPVLYGTGAMAAWPQSRSGAWCGEHTEISIEFAASVPVYVEQPYTGPSMAAPEFPDYTPQPSVLDKLKAWLRQ